MIIAYIDPGSGSILLQVLLASVLGGVAIFWQRIKMLFTRKRPADELAPKLPEEPAPHKSDDV